MAIKRVVPRKKKVVGTVAERRGARAKLALIPKFVYLALEDDGTPMIAAAGGRALQFYVYSSAAGVKASKRKKFLKIPVKR